MTAVSGANIVSNGLVFHFDLANREKSYLGAPTTNVCVQFGQGSTNPWSGDGGPTGIIVHPTMLFRKRKVSEITTGTNGNLWISGADFSTFQSTNTAFVSTFYLKRDDGVAITSATSYLYIANNTNVNGASTITQVEDGWAKLEYVRTGLNLGYPLLMGATGFPASTKLYVADWQVERDAVSSRYVAGTRNNTESIIDLTGNRVATSYMGIYDQDNFTFDGTLDSFEFPNINFTTEQTVEIWMKPTALTIRNNPYNQAYGGYGTWTLETNGTIAAYYGNGAGNAIPYTAATSGFALAPNELVCACLTRDISTVTWYKNGEYDRAEANAYGVLNAHVSNIIIGNGYAARFTGDIYSVRIYDRALTLAEVKQNFEATRSRNKFGI